MKDPKPEDVICHRCRCEYALRDDRSGPTKYCDECAHVVVEELELWKESASRVLSQIQLQEVGRSLGLPLGIDIAPRILPAILELLKDRKRLEFVVRMRLLQFVPPFSDIDHWRVTDDSIGGCPVIGEGETPEEAIDAAIEKEGE